MEGSCVRFGIVGCGAMARRHLAGYAELLRSEHRNVELVAVVDLDESRAEALAEEARVLTGSRPRVFRSIATMVEAIDGVEAVDVVTDIRAHHRVAIECVDRGLAVQIEKPLALTMRACALLLRAARRAGSLLVPVEWARRDPMSRLVRALVDDGAIGAPQLLIETGVRGGNRIVHSAWRHDRLSGGVALDLGVNTASMMRYLLGEAESVAGVARLWQPVRRRENGKGRHPASRWATAEPESVRATADDALCALVRFGSGAVAQWSFNQAGQGMPMRQRVLYGSRGSIVAPGEGTGRSPRLDLPELSSIVDENLLEHAPSYRLDPVAAALFGAERPTSYRLSTGEVDRKLFALQLHELGAVVRGQQMPELSGEDARRDAALVYAALESSESGRFVTLDEVSDMRADRYQRDLDADLGLIEVPELD